MYQAVSDHFVLALESFPALASGTVRDRAVVRSILAVHVSMRTVKAFSLEATPY